MKAAVSIIMNDMPESSTTFVDPAGLFLEQSFPGVSPSLKIFLGSVGKVFLPHSGSHRSGRGHTHCFGVPGERA